MLYIRDSFRGRCADRQTDREILTFSSVTTNISRESRCENMRKYEKKTPNNKRLKLAKNKNSGNGFEIGISCCAKTFFFFLLVSNYQLSGHSVAASLAYITNTFFFSFSFYFKVVAARALGQHIYTVYDKKSYQN